MSKFHRGNPLEVENTCIICGAKFRDTDPKPTCGSYRCLRAWGKIKTKESINKKSNTIVKNPREMAKTVMPVEDK